MSIIVKITKKWLLSLVLAVSGVGGFAASAEACVRVTTWGGNYQATYQEIAKAFEAEHGCKITWVVGSSPDHLIKSRLGQVDVATNTLLNSIAGEREGLWRELEVKNIPNLANLYENAAYSPHTIFVNVGDYVLVYNKDKLNPAPTSWNDLWKPEYKQRAVIYGLQHVPTLSLLVMQAEQNGGSIDQIEPGLERMANLLKGGNLIGALDVESQVVSLFLTGDAWIGMLETGRLKELYDKGGDHIGFVRPPEGTFPLITTLNIAKDAQDPAMAEAFVNHLLSPEVQLAFATRNLYAPTVNNAPIPDDFERKDILVQNEEFERLYIPDQEKITAEKSVWQQRLNELASQ